MIKEINSEELKDVTYLTCGSFGDINTATYRDTKAILKSDRVRNNNSTSSENTRHEFNILSSFDPYPYIILLIGYTTLDSKFTMILEFADSKTLHHFYNQQKKGTNFFLQAVSYLYHIALALKYIHQNHNLVYLDLKPNNIFLFSNHQAKLGDFGLSQHAGELISHTGSAYYMDPLQARLAKEKWDRHGKNPKANHDDFLFPAICEFDIHSFGTLLCTAILGNRIYPLEIEQLPQLTFIFLLAAKEGIPRPKLDQMPDNYASLIKRCWNPNPDERPSMEVVSDELETILRSLNQPK